MLLLLAGGLGRSRGHRVPFLWRGQSGDGPSAFNLSSSFTIAPQIWSVFFMRKLGLLGEQSLQIFLGAFVVADCCLT